MTRVTGAAAADAIGRNRQIWDVVNAQFTDGAANARWAAGGIGWGLFEQPEDDLGILGDVRGLDVIELGAGTAFLSAALARAGARPIALDLNRAQLLTARRCQTRFGLRFPLVEADGERVPVRDHCCDLVVSE